MEPWTFNKWLRIIRDHKSRAKHALSIHFYYILFLFFIIFSPSPIKLLCQKVRIHLMMNCNDKCPHIARIIGKLNLNYDTCNVKLVPLNEYRTLKQTSIYPPFSNFQKVYLYQRLIHEKDKLLVNHLFHIYFIKSLFFIFKLLQSQYY